MPRFCFQEILRYHYGQIFLKIEASFIEVFVLKQNTNYTKKKLRYRKLIF